MSSLIHYLPLPFNSHGTSQNKIVWDFDTISSVVVLGIFLVLVVVVFHVTRKTAAAAESTVQALREKGVTVQQGGISLQTSKVAPSREEYIASTQRAFERSAATLAANPSALTFGPSTLPLGSNPDDLTAPEGSAAAEGLKAAGGRERTSKLGVKVERAEDGLREVKAKSEGLGTGMDDGTVKARKGIFRRRTKLD